MKHARASSVARMACSAVPLRSANSTAAEFERRQGGIAAVDVEHAPTEVSDGARDRRPVPELAPQFDRPFEERLGVIALISGASGKPGPFEQVGLLRRIGRHVDRLSEEDDRLLVRPECRRRDRPRPAGRSGPGPPSASASGPSGRAVVGGDVVSGERAGQLVLASAFEEAGRGEVPGPAVAPGQRAVRDLADERLDEAVLAALGRSRVGLEREDLAPDERRAAAARAPLAARRRPPPAPAT